MEEDEVGTFLAFRVRRETTIEPVFNNHGGRVVKLMGDSVLVEFSSAVNAVQAAIELQKRMAIDNAPIPESRHLILRIGINLGDVIGEGSDIYGEGVNIAARLEPLADPGGIVISDKVEAEVRGKLTAAFTDIGEQQLKNIARPVRAYSLGDSGLPRPRASWFRFL
jgi:class 3 adenylate cyclase